METEQNTVTATPMQPQPTRDTLPENQPAHSIPWYVHALWISFWLFAIWYLIVYQLPIVQEQLFVAQ